MIEERNCKHELEDSILYEHSINSTKKLILNKTKLDMEVFEHFQDMRFKIDEQREKLKKSIDDISLALKDISHINLKINLMK